MTRAEAIAAAILKRVRIKFRLKDGGDHSLLYRPGGWSIPLEVRLDVYRQVEKALYEMMREAGHGGRARVDYGDGSRHHGRPCAFSVRVIAVKKERTHWPRPRLNTRLQPLSKFYQD